LNVFQRTDGACLAIVEGFRQRMLSYRASVTPKENWTAADYKAAAAKKQRRFKRLLSEMRDWVPSLQGKRVLDVGCGDAANSLQFALHPVTAAIGIDLSLPLLANGGKGEQTRRLAKEIAGEPFPARLGLLQMDATRMAFADSSVDLVISRSAMEHITPVEAVLEEIVRVTHPGGLIYLGIDPFYWARGCHKRGVVDIPFAHARMSLADYTHFVELREGPGIAEKRRRRLETLNRLTVRQWRANIEKMGCEILAWRNKESEIGATVLKQFPDIPETLLPELSPEDLLCERIEVWLRR
jgi:ubiquinone/menaquinone biosynthesis C-methylase UbiE